MVRLRLSKMPGLIKKLRGLNKKQEGYLLIEALLLTTFVAAAIVLPLSITLVQQKKVVLNDALDLGLQKASVVGYVNTGVEDAIKDHLTQMNVDITGLTITGTSSQKLRGEIIDLELSVPVGIAAQYGLRLIGGDTIEPDTPIKASGSIMSEYLP